MKKSKLFSRFFWFTVLLWMFYTITSTMNKFYLHPGYLYYHIGFMAVAVLFIALRVGTQQKELSNQIGTLVKQTKEESKFLRI